MALENGDMVIPAGTFASATGVADLSVGTLTPGGVLVGIYSGVATESCVVWNNGFGIEGDGSLLNPEQLRKCTPYTGTDLIGKRVRWTGKPPAFDGVVIQEFDTELDDTQGNGTQTPVVVVRTDQFVYVAEPGNLETL